MEINTIFNNFYNNVRPRLTMGELQVLAAFCKYASTEDSADIPGSKEYMDRAGKD